MVRLSITRLSMTVNCGALDLGRVTMQYRDVLNVKVLNQEQAMVVKIDFLNTQ